MKLGQKVKISKFYKRVYELPFLSNEKMCVCNRYIPVTCEISGIITGYKRITINATHVRYEFLELERDTGAEVKKHYYKNARSKKEYIYVVQTTLKKKYFVRKEWLV